MAATLDVLELRRVPLRVVPVAHELRQFVEEGAGFVAVFEFHLGVDNAFDGGENKLLPFFGTGGVDVVEGVLLQIDGINEFAFEVDDKVVERGSFFADNLHHLRDIVAPA